ncbi:MAG: DUF4442 domain-containing protein [Haliscomenobacter sp.]|nr:DUF4442 domain-containing protein [Haliscomenobacter sp.]
MALPNAPIIFFDAQSAPVVRLLRALNTPWKMRLFFLWKLPSLLFWGVRIRKASPDQTEVLIPFSWRAQNPFRSTYFAALAGAGELAGGVMAMIAIEGRGPVSMLVTNLEASFSKKATGPTVFTCSQGAAIREAIQRALDTGEGQTLQVLSVGRLENGTEVCRVELTWSFKAKRQGVSIQETP